MAGSGASLMRLSRKFLAHPGLPVNVPVEPYYEICSASCPAQDV